jgi:quercetin dioxygenase-like cupin family protein
MNYVFQTTNLKRYRFPTHINDLVIDRLESQFCVVFMVIVEPGKSVLFHSHPDLEQVFYVTEGNGLLVIGGDEKEFVIKQGDVVRIPVDTLHTVRAVDDNGCKYLAVDCFGPNHSEDESTWDEHVKGNCRKLGWDYDKVVGMSGDF